MKAKISRDCPASFQPVGHRLVVRMIAAEVEDINPDSVIEIPDEVMNKYETGAQQGVIVGIGPLAWAEFGDGSPWAELGDVVALKRYCGTNRKIGDVQYRVVDDIEIMAVDRSNK